MSKQKKQLEKEKRRERARRVEKQRRIDADVCAELMFRSELAWDDRDLEGCRRLLDKVLKIRPNHAEALERLAAVCFRLNRLEEGLAYYERLREPPQRPPVTYNAAVAAWNTGRTEQCKGWVAEFLEATRRSKQFVELRKSARVLLRDAERRIKAEAARARIEPTEPAQADLFSAKPPAVPAGHPPPSPAREVSPDSHGVSLDQAADLPAFPPISAPDIPVQFEFERMPLENPFVSPAAEVFLHRDYALLKLQKGFDEMQGDRPSRGTGAGAAVAEWNLPSSGLHAGRDALFLLLFSI